MNNYSLRRPTAFLALVLLSTLPLVVIISGQSEDLTRKAIAPRNVLVRQLKLFKRDRELIARARAVGESTVILMVAAAEGAAPAAAKYAEQLGGEIQYRNDQVGYLRVRMPIAQIDDLAAFDRIESLAVALDNKKIQPPRTFKGPPDPPTPTSTAGSLRASASSTDPWPPTWSDYPLRHPYSPLADIDAAAFQKEHPTFDGRGVTIADLEDSADILLPEFQTAYTIDGKRVPKLANIITTADPRLDASEDDEWVDMRELVEASNRQFVFQGRVFSAPYDGPFRVGLFKYRSSPTSLLGRFIDRVGSRQGDREVLGVLWDEQSNDIWVDTDRDFSFADEKAMTDYVRRQDISIFGKDDPATPVRESIGFTVSIDVRNKFVHMNLGTGSHGTMIYGCVVGNPEPNGRLRGIAPGARIVFVEMEVSAVGLLEALIRVFEDPTIDLVSSSKTAIAADESALLGDDRHPFNIIAQRLSRRYPKLYFSAGGNTPSVGIPLQEGLAPLSVSVGAYESQESYRINWGFIPEGYDHIHWGGRSHGPSSIGSIKPDLLAPSGSMSLSMGFLEDYRRKVIGLWQVPPGYTLSGGSSAAAPMAAGIASLVVSAAKQTHVRYDATTLKAALTGSARYLPNLQSHEQGNGLMQVRAAYDLLRKLQNAPKVIIESRAPVRTKFSGYLQPPNEGVGIYEREGWTAGDKGTRTITFTRTSGPTEPMTFSLNWEGDTSTFNSAESIVLPLNKPTELPVTIAVKQAGVHSALLTLRNPAVPGHVYRVLNTVVAALKFGRENQYALTENVTVPVTGDREIFIEVPPDVRALSYSIKGKPGVGTFREELRSPSRKNIWNPLSPSSLSGALVTPERGVWGLTVAVFLTEFKTEYKFDPDVEQPVKSANATVTVLLAGISMAITPLATPATDSRINFDLPVKLTNQFGAVTASASSGSIGSAFHSRRAISQGEQQIYEVVVPEGATSFRTRIGNVSDRNADLDIYLIDCTSPDKAKNIRAKAATIDRGGEVEVFNPTPGLWKIVVDAYRVPSGRTRYDYMDIYTHPKFGSVTTTDSPEKRETGATWNTTAHIWVASPADNQRTLEARLIATGPDIKDYNGNYVALGSVDIPLGRLRSLRNGSTLRPIANRNEESLAQR